MPSRITGDAKEAERRVRVLIADDHPAITMTVRSTLERHPRFEVCGEAPDGAKAIEEAEKLKPDVVVLNASMPVLNGFEAAREIKKNLPKTAIVILSSNTDQRFIEEARQIGARAYVAKTTAGEKLINAIEAAVVGGDFVLME
jgi:DNA-binding NarL/FixJ family response regulator